MHLYLVLCLLLHVPFCLGMEGDEQSCSRFEFDHKLLESLVRLELSHEAMKEEWRNLKTREITPDIGYQALRGGNYIRWGRTTCPENVDTVYKGYAGGSWYGNSGAASNFLCLPEQPQWSNKTNNDNTKNSYGARVYGAEYQLSGNSNFFGRTFHNHNAPCVVCDTPRSNILMIPGRIFCYDGWTVEYIGYLTAGHNCAHSAASEYVCLDETPEKVAGGITDENGILFYLAEARCGSLKCPPYVDGRVMSCVVCSK